MAEAVKQLGSLDILVNCASLPGGSRSAVGPIDGLDEDALLVKTSTPNTSARCAVLGQRFLLKEQLLEPNHQHQRW